MNDNFVIENGALISYEGSEIEIEIPEGVHTIKKDSIPCYNEIQVLQLPDSIEIVEKGALDRCNKLTRLIVPAKTVCKRYCILSILEPFTSYFEWRFPDTLNEIVIYDNEKELDLSKLDWKKIGGRVIVRIENETTNIKLGDIDRDVNKQPLIYINNYVENVQIDAPAVWNKKNIIFRAPKPNMTETTDNSVELTLAPRATWTNDTRWSCPIRLNVSAVTYLYPVELACYDNETHQGCKLLLLGNRIEDIPLERLSLETYPSIIVWEDYDTVYNKLKAKGWTK